eukprot:TRINITY_DN11067_c0_g1_i1.p1 TRINITY_DN11067_c0_g1~~TRINITY_DN11067_c0_g1_i1.p1  ORF type:complete len:143 (-),score=56.42 TRINITY_DN11067_c0_g1_i1:48-476(-)
MQQTVQEGKPADTLLKYDDPIESTVPGNKSSADSKTLYKKIELPPLEAKPTNDDILNAILPPREWIEGNSHYIQYVSHKQSEREEVSALNKELDKRLTERQARDNPICPIREELFAQVFDEVIRQATLYLSLIHISEPTRPY